MRWFRAVRIALLLSIFVGVAFYSKNQKLKSRAWIEPLDVVIYPINGDDSLVAEDYIHNLEGDVFIEVEAFFNRESEFYHLNLATPFKIILGPILTERPPESPQPDAGIIAIVWWSLKFRYWAYRHTPDDASNLQRVRVFAHFHEPHPKQKLQHSLGLDKGLLATVHAFASKQQENQNNIVIAHELLHTVGATDKYDHNGAPLYPYGYADPEQQPLYPQTRAEIMAAQIALTESRSKMAANLDQCIIGVKTAQEINWIAPQAE